LVLPRGVVIPQSALSNSLTLEGWLLKTPSLFEAEITGPAGGRGTDNHVIQHLDLQNPGAFGEPASQAGIWLGRA
jgi:hypothetical protein